MNNTTIKDKALQLAIASNAVRNYLSRFREAQHRVMFQMTNPSLDFSYEFKKSGEEMEQARINLADAIGHAEMLAYDIISECRNENK